MNEFAALSTFAFITAVILKGKGDNLISELKKDSEFFKWLFSFFLLAAIINKTPALKPLFSIFVIALALKILPKSLKNLNAWADGKKTVNKKTVNKKG